MTGSAPLASGRILPIGESIADGGTRLKKNFAKSYGLLSGKSMVPPLPGPVVMLNGEKSLR
jgi:hypothetical protein